jgi:glutathione S-transferase
MQYLEDKYSGFSPSLTQTDPEKRAFDSLLVRMHDLYIASPNSTQPGYSHSQGAMYLSPYETKFVSAERCLAHKDRAAKIAEIHKQLSWLEENMVGGPYLTGDKICHSDMTWFPTCVFIEYMLPRAFGWPMIFHETEMFPKLTAWFEHL